jgi:methionine-rich copper-binding protein CopC
VTRLLRGVVTAALIVLLSAAPVFAHAELEESDPADGATIQTPYTLTATFSEEIGTDRSWIEVVSVASGAEVARGGISEEDATVMTVDLPALEPGEYVANWTAVTPDDNGVTRGQITFTVAVAATASPTATRTPGSSATTAPTVAPPTLRPTPVPTATPGGGQSGSGNDVLLALVIGAIVLLGLGAYLYTRSRR